MSIQTVPYDAADYLTDAATIHEYLTEELTEGEAPYVADALAAVCRARGGVQQLAFETGIEAEILDRALADRNNIDADTIRRVIRAFDPSNHGARLA